MPVPKFNKYRAAMDVLQRGRDQMMEELAESLLDETDDLMESTFTFQEMLENQGTRLHFLSLLMAQLEQSAEALDELRQYPIQELVGEPEEPEAMEENSPEPPAPRKKSSKPRAKNGRKLHQKQREGAQEES